MTGGLDVSAGGEKDRFMPEEGKHEDRRRHGGHFLIPAGALIGLGAGMLAGQAGAGVLIGLGLGFAGSAVLTLRGGEDGGQDRGHGSAWIMAAVGLFLILLGLSIVLSPALPWTAIFAVFLILIGLGFVARGLARRG